MAEHNYCCGVSRGLTFLGNCLAPFILLFLRLLWGVLFFFAGLDKFADIQQTAAAFGDIGIPAPLFNAYLVALVETLGGLFLAFGFLTRYVSFLLLVVMAVAIGTTELNLLANILLAPAEFVAESRPLTYLVTAAVVFSFGPGIFSIDALIERFYCKNKCC